MLRFYASDWNEVLRALERLSDILHHNHLEFLSDKRVVTEPLEKVAEHCRSLGLRFSASYAEELLATIQAAPTLDELLASITTAASKKAPKSFGSSLLVREVQTLRKRIDDELANREFFALESGRASYFSEARPFGEEVFNAFPSATIDIEEAAKCLALDRYTACVGGDAGYWVRTELGCVHQSDKRSRRRRL